LRGLGRRRHGTLLVSTTSFFADKYPFYASNPLATALIHVHHISIARAEYRASHHIDVMYPCHSPRHLSAVSGPSPPPSFITPITPSSPPTLKFVNIFPCTAHSIPPHPVLPAETSLLVSEHPPAQLASPYPRPKQPAPMSPSRPSRRVPQGRHSRKSRTRLSNRRRRSPSLFRL
jgi:hypothetical protein